MKKQFSGGQVIKLVTMGNEPAAFNYQGGGLCKLESPRREVVRSSAGASGVYPPFLGSFAQHTPRHDIGCPTPCKIIILPNKTIPQWIF